jgi:hypothetical protein
VLWKKIAQKLPLLTKSPKNYEFVSRRAQLIFEPDLSQWWEPFHLKIISIFLKNHRNFLIISNDEFLLRRAQNSA